MGNSVFDLQKKRSRCWQIEINGSNLDCFSGIFFKQQIDTIKDIDYYVIASEFDLVNSCYTYHIFLYRERNIIFNLIYNLFPYGYIYRPYGKISTGIERLKRCSSSSGYGSFCEFGKRPPDSYYC